VRVPAGPPITSLDLAEQTAYVDVDVAEQLTAIPLLLGIIRGTELLPTSTWDRLNIS